MDLHWTNVDLHSVGVDINRVVNHRHASGTLQYVCGLGPRKAQGLINSIYRQGAKIGRCAHRLCREWATGLD